MKWSRRTEDESLQKSLSQILDWISELAERYVSVSNPDSATEW